MQGGGRRFESAHLHNNKDILYTENRIRIGSQATKGIRWMPWRQEAMKDVANCDKPRGAVSKR